MMYMTPWVNTSVETSETLLHCANILLQIQVLVSTPSLTPLLPAATLHAPMYVIVAPPGSHDWQVTTQLQNVTPVPTHF